eukprot:TRINITY_DN2175_c0_g1_i1.p1 TRINITY_DN2175_c0_g1~~TRINITY_DN2175_c0_g1_i1.p1  ORF type:complete len:1842 (+),score=601.91 TRINITY_DN2175_c0_g1_i1:806-5527(+)
MSPTMGSRTRGTRLTYHKVSITDDDGGPEMAKAAPMILGALEKRRMYQRCTTTGDALATPMPPSSEKPQFRMNDGVVQFDGQTVFPVPYQDYVEHVKGVYRTVEDGPCKTTCRNRLKILEEKYLMFNALNSELEESHCPYRKGGGVFAKCTKVDNSVRLTTAMHVQDLLDFIVDAFRKKPETHAYRRPPDQGGAWMTLREVFQKHEITEPEALTVEGIGLHPPAQKRFHRFDIFSEKYNRGGKRSAELLKLFLKRDGPFYADIVRPILEDHDKDFDAERVATEYKLPIFGLSEEEWTKLAEWVFVNHLGEKRSNFWIVQIPRMSELRSIYKCATLQEQLDNIFLPLWKATLASSAEDRHKYRYLSRLLLEVGGFNIISDEMSRGQELPDFRPPNKWPWKENPPNLYFNYYVWANICSLNQLRKMRGLNTFQFRPNCGEGEQGVNEHLASGFLLADAINHGVRMEKSPVLQYLYYLAQVGIVFSPLANNGLGNPPYRENPFHAFQMRGMRVSLGTDDPLHYHHSRKPCIEEYGTAQKIYRLGPVDLTEIARNSVLISGFPHRVKVEWLGPDFLDPVMGNDSKKSNVPDVRLAFREDNLLHETKILHKMGGGSSKEETGMDISQCFDSPGAMSHSAPQWGDDDGAVQRLGEIDQSMHFPRIEMLTPTTDTTLKQAGETAEKLANLLALRKKYIWQPPRHRGAHHAVHCCPVNTDDGGRDEDALRGSWAKEYEVWPLRGVYHYRQRTGKNADQARKELEWLPKIAELGEFHEDFEMVYKTHDDVQVKQLAHKRLQVLDHTFRLHMALNGANEAASSGGANQESRDFYQTPKVDTHIHAPAGMTARQLLEFLLDKARNAPDDIVKLDADLEPVTLSKTLRDIGITPDRYHTFTVDHLLAHADMKQPGDEHNPAYSPMTGDDLRSLLLSPDNYMGGRYFAELLKSSFDQYQRDRYTYAEMRITIYGRSREEWHKLAGWFDTHGMASIHNKFLVQVPRIYSIWREKGIVNSFMDFIANVFKPLWEVSLHPASNPKLHNFLKHVSGFDSVDSENVTELPLPDTPPDEWTTEQNPPYAYWMYMMWANIRALNEFRSLRGFTTFAFRPHCGEAGPIGHLLSGFLTADGVNHGIQLRQDPVLEYLYYLAQIPLAISPLSNNSTVLDYLHNPFPNFFRRGLNVSLSTDNPLQFHLTQEPLIEEYSIASKVWKLGPNDMCEIARNSVIMSGVNDEVKAKLIGPKWFLSSAQGNSSEQTHVADIRVAFRFEVYHSEIKWLLHAHSKAAGRQQRTSNVFRNLRAKLTREEERALIVEMDKARQSRPSVVRRRYTSNDSMASNAGSTESTESARQRAIIEGVGLQRQLHTMRAALLSQLQPSHGLGLADPDFGGDGGDTDCGYFYQHAAANGGLHGSGRVYTIDDGGMFAPPPRLASAPPGPEHDRWAFQSALQRPHTAAPQHQLPGYYACGAQTARLQQRQMDPADPSGRPRRPSQESATTSGWGGSATGGLSSPCSAAASGEQREPSGERRPPRHPPHGAPAAQQAPPQPAPGSARRGRTNLARMLAVDRSWDVSAQGEPPQPPPL